MDGMKKSLGTILSCRVHHSSGAHIMRLKPCNPLAARPTMESRMPGNSHVRFGERDGETDLSNEARRTISTLRPDLAGHFVGQSNRSHHLGFSIKFILEPRFCTAFLPCMPRYAAHSPNNKSPPDILLAHLCNFPEPRFSSRRILQRNEAQPSSKIAPCFECGHIGGKGFDNHCTNWTYAWHCSQTLQFGT